jgi:hypothetical protein
MAKLFGELLVSEGRISHEILTRALELQGFNEKGLRLGGILLKWGLLKEEEILEMLGRIHGCAFVGWKMLSNADPEAVKLLSPAHAARLGAMPYGLDDRFVLVAFVNPSDLAAIDEVTAITRKRVKPAVAMEVRLLQAQQQFYDRSVSPGVWAVLQRLDRASKKRQGAAPKFPNLEAFSETVPVGRAAARELPDFSVPEDWEPVVSLAAMPDASPLAPVDLEPEDPFSDQFSLKQFIADAIEFFDGLPNSTSDVFDEPVEDLDPESVEAAPRVAASSDPNATAPSKLRPRNPNVTSLLSF